MCDQHIREDDNSYKELEFDCLINSPPGCMGASLTISYLAS